VLNFYLLPGSIRIAFSVCALLCSAAAALVLVLLRYRRSRGLIYILESAFFILTLFQAFINTTLIAQTQHNLADGFILTSGYIISRYVIFIAAAAVFICLCIKKKPLLPGVIIISCFLTLPFTEKITGRAFPFLFAVALMILLASEIFCAVLLVKELKTSISGLSIKQAMDSLNTGILFYKKNGYILMQNNKMREIMIKISGRVLFNGKIFFEKIIIPNSENYDGGTYFYTSDDTAWLFATEEIKINKKDVIRLTAADMSEQHRANILSREKQVVLKTRQEQLKIFIKNIEEISRTEELFRIKTEAHDAQNKKLTVLLRYLRNGEYPDRETLATLGESLLESIQKNIEISENPQAELDIFINIYEQAGIYIRLTGDLPSDKNTASVMLYVLREAAANAVIHGYADKIYVWFMYNDGKCVMRVTDNSTQLLIKITEGGGIAGMRRQLEKVGGKLYINTSPRFTLTAVIPITE